MTEETGKFNMVDSKTNLFDQTQTFKQESPVLPEEREVLLPMPDKLDMKEAVTYLGEVIGNDHTFFIAIKRALPPENGKPDSPLKFKTTLFNPIELTEHRNNISEWDDLVGSAVYVELHVNTLNSDKGVDWAGGRGAKAHPDTGFEDSKGNRFERRVIKTGIEEGSDDRGMENPIALATRWDLFKEKVLKVKENAKKVKEWLAARNIMVSEGDEYNLPQTLLNVRNREVTNFMTQIADMQAKKAQEKYGSIGEWKKMILRGAENLGLTG